MLKKILALSLMLSFTSIAYAEHHVPQMNRPHEVRQLKWTNQEILPAVILEAVYENQVGSGRNHALGPEIRVILLKGKVARAFESTCGCVGLYDTSEPNTLYVVEDSPEKPWLIILLHELAHLLQFRDDRINRLPDYLSEQEAEYLAQAVYNSIKGRQW